MSKVAIVFEARREGYGIDQLFEGHFEEPMTVGCLREILEDLPDDMYFVLSHDNGYTYGSINECFCRFSVEKGRDWEMTESIHEALNAYENED